MSETLTFWNALVSRLTKELMHIESIAMSNAKGLLSWLDKVDVKPQFTFLRLITIAEQRILNVKMHSDLI